MRCTMFECWNCEAMHNVWIACWVSSAVQLFERAPHRHAQCPCLLFIILIQVHKLCSHDGHDVFAGNCDQVGVKIEAHTGAKIVVICVSMWWAYQCQNLCQNWKAYQCQNSGHTCAKIGGLIGGRPNVIRVGILVPDSLGKAGAHPGSAMLLTS